MFSVKIAFLSILFILRLRFPIKKSIASIIRERYGNDTLKIQRRLESVDTRLRKAKLDLDFLINCRNHGLIPHFLNFRLANNRLRHSSSYPVCQLRLLDEEIRTKRSSVRQLSNQLSEVLDAFRNSVSFLDFVHFSCKLSDSVGRCASQRQQIQTRKFDRLQQEDSRCRNDPDKVIFNFSSHILSPAQKKLLSRGLNFSLAPKKLLEHDYLAPFEMLYRSVSGLPIFSGDRRLLKTRLKDIALSSFHGYNSCPAPQVLTRAESVALKELQSVPNLVIQKSDKGNSVVLLDQPQYVEKMNQILSDGTKFQEIPVEPGKDLNRIFSLESRVKKELVSASKEGAFTEQEFNQLSPSGSRPGRLYGLGKVHKPGCPLRPILSAIGTPTYALAKFLVPLLAPITSNEFTIKDSFSFAKEMSSLDRTGCFMASFDVKSLFTNIPLAETLDICVNNLYSSSSAPADFSKEVFQSLLRSAVSETFFTFEGKLYQQIDGVAMGSPLGPTLANAFLCHYEKIWLDACPVAFKPVYYRRYVDDTFLLFSHPSHVPLFLNFLNGQHRNIEFTSEIESGGILPFLDTTVSRSGRYFQTSLYRKPTFSGVYSHFDSFSPLCYKFGLVFTLLFRAFSICSSFLSFHNEIVMLKSILRKNGYPLAMIDTVISKFLNKLHCDPCLPISTVPCKPVLIVLPFIGQLSTNVRNRILVLFKRSLPQVSCRIILKPCLRLSSFFPYKDRFPSAIKSLVVYKFTCGNCNVTYIGKSKRHLKTRVCEHIGVSDRTGRVSGAPRDSAVYQHFMSSPTPYFRPYCNRPSIDDFMVIGTAKNDYELQIKESILISKFKPELNRNIWSLPLTLLD